jgi:hypothetical protein
MTGFYLAVLPLAVFPALKVDRRWGTYKEFTLAMGILANFPGRNKGCKGS